MDSRIAIPLLVLGALAFACGPRPNTEASTPVHATATVAQVAKKRATRPARLHPDLAVVRHRDGAVRVALHIANDGDKRAELSFPSGQTHDVVVLDSTGREVWRASEGRLYTQALQHRGVSGGDTATFDATWRPSHARGRYVAVATLHSTNYPVERRAEIVIP